MRVEQLADFLDADNSDVIRRLLYEVNSKRPGAGSTSPQGFGGTGSRFLLVREGETVETFDWFSTDTSSGDGQSREPWYEPPLNQLTFITGLLVITISGESDSRMRFVGELVRKLGSQKLTEWIGTLRSTFSWIGRDPSLRQGFP